MKGRHAAKPEYMAPAVWAEVEDLHGKPGWQFLARPSMSHIRVHYGELTSQLETLRTAPSSLNFYFLLLAAPALAFSSADARNLKKVALHFSAASKRGPWPEPSNISICTRPPFSL